MFTIQDRHRLCERVLELAKADTRVVAGAVGGSLARTAGDRWSDLDLTFGVSDGVPAGDVLGTVTVMNEFAATRLFDRKPDAVRTAAITGLDIGQGVRC